MEGGDRLSLENIRALLEVSVEVNFQAQGRQELYGWVNQTLRRQDYGRLQRAGKGLARPLCGQDDRIEPRADDAPDRVSASAATGAPR